MNFAIQVGIAFVGMAVIFFLISGVVYVMHDKLKVNPEAALIGCALFVSIFITLIVLVARHSK